MLHNLEIKDRGIFLDEQEIKGITDFKLEKSAMEQAATLLIKLNVNTDTEVEKETDSPFEGMSFKYPPVSKEHFIKMYEDYAKRCSN